MTNEITETALSLWKMSGKTKHTPSGWISGNAICCHHRGESKDDRGRGGLMITPNSGFNWHCFNCTFKAGWTPGHLLSTNTRQLFKWLGLSDTDISKLGLVALRLKDEQNTPTKKLLNFELTEKELPKDSKSINEWIAQGTEDEDLLKVVNYIVEERQLGWDWYNWHWSPTAGYRDRVILPFYYDGKIVGSTARKITPGKPKYLNDSQPGYVFNLDHQNYNRKYVLVMEGQFDAIAIEGVAIGHNDPNEVQCARINSLGKEVIVVPDHDKPGAKLIKSAIEHKWSVSLPPWSDDVKDVADAVKAYGRLYTLATILHYRETNEIKIQLLKKRLESLDE